METIHDLLTQVLKPSGAAPIYNAMIALTNPVQGINIQLAAGVTTENGIEVEPHFRFRAGSMSKPFTAVLALQMVEQGLITLDTPLSACLPQDVKTYLSDLHWYEGRSYTDSIQVSHLLSHASGLPDYFAGNEQFMAFVMAHPEQRWNWKLVMEQFFEAGLHRQTKFAPGNGFHYADTNYLLLALIIEQIGRKPFHALLSERIFARLILPDTYLEFHEASPGAAPMVYPFYGADSLERVNTGFDWGGGGLVSSLSDLSLLVRALYEGRFFEKSETQNLMFTFPDPPITGRIDLYGMGVQQKVFQKIQFFGHDSAYASMMLYAPELQTSLVLTLNQAGAYHKALWLTNKIAGILSALPN
ncbi:MAG: beta-lactamase family protein [Saprospiraceae bacterium]|nr:beta-lactamase family protein [Saprospiraceae bacterium]